MSMKDTVQSPVEESDMGFPKMDTNPSSSATSSHLSLETTSSSHQNDMYVSQMPQLMDNQEDVHSRILPFYHFAIQKENDVLSSSQYARSLFNEKLRLEFNLAPESELIRDFSCWLIRSVLLKGHLYLTSSHLCFYALLPSETSTISKTGYLKKPNQIKTYTSCWSALKDDILTFYEDYNSTHFILGAVKMSDVQSIEPSSKRENGFTLFLKDNKKYNLQADSASAMHDWVSKLKASMMRSKMEGSKVKFAIPLSCIIETELSQTFFIPYLQ